MLCVRPRSRQKLLDRVKPAAADLAVSEVAVRDEEGWRGRELEGARDVERGLRWA